MIRRFLWNRGSVLRNVSVNNQLNWTLNVKIKSWEECKLFHLSLTNNNNKKKRTVKEENYADQDLSLKVVKVWHDMTVSELQNAMNINPRQLGLMLPKLNLKPSDPITSFDNIAPYVHVMGFKLQIIPKPRNIAKNNKKVVPAPHKTKSENLVRRPPVVTVMGHVDHGKTTLLDSLRNTFVAQQEFGGITQHIGAFSVEVKPGERITFIDTPGHAAFTAMRARGAGATDLVILVIAADDGVMEQTVESIKIASEANVPIIVAVNKIDKTSALPVEEIKQKLLLEGVQVEDCGGDIQLVPISALKKINLDLLTETILLQADIMNLTGDPKGPISGVIIESNKDNSLGNVATMIVKNGTLRRGIIIVAGHAYARVRKMVDEKGNVYNEAPPSTPVRVLGWKELPFAGEEVIQMESESQAKRLVEERVRNAMALKIEAESIIIKERAAEEKKKLYEIKDCINMIPLKKERSALWFELMQKKHKEEKAGLTETGPHLKIILKGDVYGSLDVLMGILQSYDKQDECKLTIVNASVGDVNPTDLEQAEIFKASIYAFNVTVHQTAKELLREKSIDIHYHNVLYKLLDDIKDELSSRIPLKDEEEVRGEAEVLQNFLISKGKKKVSVAGSRCIKGQLKQNSLYRILRNGEVIYEGKLLVMKNEKIVVTVIPKGMECGLMFDSFTEKFEPGDKIVCYDMIKVPQKTTWDPGF